MHRRWIVVASIGLARVAAAEEGDPTSPSPVAYPEPVQPAAAPEAEKMEKGPPKAPSVFWELGADSAYKSPPIRGGTTPFGAGFGGHIGLSIPSFYFGARVQYFLGGTDIDVTNRTLVYGAEIGYGFRIARFGNATLSLRPTLGVGALRIYHSDPSTVKATPDVVTTASGRTTTSRPSDTITVDNVYVEPSVLVMITSGIAFLSVAPSMMIIPGITYGGDEAMTWMTYGFQGSIGLRL